MVAERPHPRTVEPVGAFDLEVSVDRLDNATAQRIDSNKPELSPVGVWCHVRQRWAAEDLSSDGIVYRSEIRVDLNR